MADGFSFRVHADALKADLERINRETRKQTTVGLKAVAKELVRAEKGRAPVYRGPGGIKRSTKKHPTNSKATGGAPIIGLLKSSIKQGRPRGHGESVMIVVGPGGGRVNLYKGKIERKYGFAAKSHAEVTPQAQKIMSQAWERAIKRT